VGMLATNRGEKGEGKLSSRKKAGVHTGQAAEPHHRGKNREVKEKEVHAWGKTT